MYIIGFRLSAMINTTFVSKEAKSARIGYGRRIVLSQLGRITAAHDIVMTVQWFLDRSDPFLAPHRSTL